MSSLSKPYTFTPDTYAIASQVNADFDSLYGWVNSNAIWSDASVAFTGVPVGPAVDPTSANQLVRKQYVDRCPQLSGGWPGHVTQMVFGNFSSHTPDSNGNFTVTFSTPFANACNFVIFSIDIGTSVPLAYSLGGAPTATTAGCTVFNSTTGAAWTSAVSASYLAFGH